MPCMYIKCLLFCYAVEYAVSLCMVEILIVRTEKLVVSMLRKPGEILKIFIKCAYVLDG